MDCQRKKECKDCMKYKKKINAPTMAYKAVYGEYPKEPIKGRTNYPKKSWKGIEVDENLKDEWLEKLNSLDVEIKSTEEGKGDGRVAFVIFRMPEDKDELYKKVEENLKNQGEENVSSDFGLEGRPRICVAKDIKVGEAGWEEWWSSIPEKLDKAYKKAVE